MKKILYPLVLLSLLIGSFAPQSTYATLTQDRAITGEGSQTDGTYVGGALNYTNLNSNDGATTYLQYSAYGGIYYHSYSMQTFSTSYQSISNVIVPCVWTTGNNNNTIKLYIRIGGVNYYSATKYLNTVWVYQTDTETWNTNPATGLAWTASDINNAEFGFQGAVYTNGINISYLKITITYTPLSAPTVITSTASGIGYVTGNHTATLHGSVDATGGENADMQGFEWGITSNTTMPASIEPRTLTYTGNWTQVGSFGVNDFNYSMITEGLALCTAYYYRAYAHNSLGWAYGDELSFSTLCNPIIVTQDAAYITTTTARLNSSVVTDGGQATDVRFCYGTASGNCTYVSNCTTASCNCTSYNVTAAWVENTYTSGQTPYIDLAALTANTTYYFCAQIRNDVNCFCGGQLSFTTESGLNEPSDFVGIAAPKSISLSWVKSSGATRTLIRYKLGSYPTGTGDGTSIYFDTQTSYLHTGLTPGTTYYYMAWGESGGGYSTGNTTLMMTTLPAVAGNEDLPLPATPSLWFSAPDYTNMQNMPFYSIVNFFADSFEIPKSTMWYWLALTTCAAIGVLVYTTIGNYNLIMTILVVGVSLVIGCFMKQIPMWHLFPYAVLAVVGIFVGERR
jgi:hypothetical protein